MSEKFRDLYAKRARSLTASTIRELTSLVSKPEIISLAGGWPAPEVFPVEPTVEIIQDILDKSADSALQYGASEGLREFREFLIDWIKEKEGIDADLENLIITSGSTQGMHLASNVLINPGDVSVVGLPTYFGGTGAMKNFGAELIGVPLDKNGMKVKVLRKKLGSINEDRVKLLYIQPSFQNPSGTTMPLTRRKELLNLANEFNFLILEDSPYSDLRYEGDDIPSLKSLDKSGRVIYLKSLSKIFSPGVRLSLFVGESSIVRKAVIARQFDDVCPNVLTQYLVFEYFKRGYVSEHVKKLKSYYKEKRDLMLDLLENYFPEEIQWNNPKGGFFIFVQLPEKVKAEKLLEQALEENVAFVYGAPFFIDEGGKNTMRLSFAQPTKEEIKIAVKKLANLLES